MERQLPRGDALLRARLADQAFGQGRTLARRDHPADDIPAEDVENHVEIEVGPLRRAEQLRDGCFKVRLLWSSFSPRLGDGASDRGVADMPAPPRRRNARIRDGLAFGAP